MIDTQKFGLIPQGFNQNNSEMIVSKLIAFSESGHMRYLELHLDNELLELVPSPTLRASSYTSIIGAFP